MGFFGPYHPNQASRWLKNTRHLNNKELEAQKYTMYYVCDMEKSGRLGAEQNKLPSFPRSLRVNQVIFSRGGGYAEGQSGETQLSMFPMKPKSLNKNALQVMASYGIPRVTVLPRLGW